MFNLLSLYPRIIIVHLQNSLQEMWPKKKLLLVGMLHNFKKTQKQQKSQKYI
jgi:hypothetical protein